MCIDLPGPGKCFAKKHQLLFKLKVKSKNDCIMHNEVIEKASTIPNFKDCFNHSVSDIHQLYSYRSFSHSEPPSLDTFSGIKYKYIKYRVSGRF